MRRCSPGGVLRLLVQGALGGSCLDSMGGQRLGGIGCLVYRAGKMCLATDGWGEEGLNL